jgi:hypothetical protein
MSDDYIEERRDNDWGYYLLHPDCPEAAQSSKQTLFRWCTHQREYYNDTENNPPEFAEGANLIRVASALTPPEFTNAVPFLGWVRIAIEGISNAGSNFQFAKVTLRHPSSIGIMHIADLGVIHQGIDGRNAIARMLADYMMSKLAPGETWNPAEPIKTTCKSSIHSVYENKEVKRIFRLGPDYKQFLLYSLVFDQMCLACLLQTYTGDNYGLDASLGQPDKIAMSSIGSLTDQEEVF